MASLREQVMQQGLFVLSDEISTEFLVLAKKYV